jgi:hypothetical protein
MRALSGAIITAGALIGLGLICIGLGIRYQGYAFDPTSNAPYVRFRHLDTAMAVAFIALILTLLVGLVTAFVGLAYHHERRYREYQIHSGGRTSTSAET